METTIYNKPKMQKKENMKSSAFPKCKASCCCCCYCMTQIGGNARQSFFDEFRTKVPAHGETRETRPEVSTGRWTRSPWHKEKREREETRGFNGQVYEVTPPHMEKREKEEFIPRFRRAGSLARSTTAIGYSLKSIGCGSWYWSGKVFDPVERRVKLRSSLRTFLLFTLAKEI